MKFIIVEGNPQQGFQYFGPFENPEEADEFGSGSFSSEEWWTAPLLVKVENGISEQEREPAKLHLY